MGYYKFFFVALLIGISFAFYYIIYPFFLSVVFGLILAHFFKKPYYYFSKRINEKVASMISVVLVVVVIVIPFSFTIFLLSSEASRGYDQVEKIIALGLKDLQVTLEENKVYQDLKQDPEMVKAISSALFDQSVENIEGLVALFLDAIKNTITFLFSKIQGVLLNLTSLLINFLIMLYLLYFFFKEGDNLMDHIKKFIPMEGEETQELLDEAFKVIDATVIGTVIIGVLEGTYGGLLFFWQGVPSPVTWGVIMVIFSMLPVVGTNGILIPLAIYRLITGDYFSAIVITVIGCGGIMISQNILRPRLVGDRSGLHPALIVISTVGGISTIGITGFLIGPIVATLFVVFWKLFRQKIAIDRAEAAEKLSLKG